MAEGRFLNIDPDGADITADIDRYKQRIIRGVMRPLQSTPYHAERGTRISEFSGKSTKFAIPAATIKAREFFRRYYPEINATVWKLRQITPTVEIEFELDITEE